MPNPTPPTEDRDWKESKVQEFDELYYSPANKLGALMWNEDMKQSAREWFSKALATAEARGYERGRMEQREENETSEFIRNAKTH